MVSVDRIIGAAAKRQSGIAGSAARRAGVMAESFDGWYSGVKAAEFSTRMGELANAAAAASARTAEASSMLMIREMSGRDPRRGASAVVGSARYGVTASEAYDRLPRHYRYSVAKGLTAAEALRSTVDRSRRMLMMDAILASREKFRSIFSANADVVQGYRRVLRPELSKTGSCGLCVVASDNVYSVEDLMPIHAGCNCAVAPIIGDNDPGRDLNDEDISLIYGVASPGRVVGAPTKSELTGVRVTVDEHGEYGPVLADSRSNRKRAEDFMEQAALRRAALDKEFRDAVAGRDSGVSGDREVVNAAMALRNDIP